VYTVEGLIEMLLNNKATSTDWFAVKSGVRQGCIILPILFLVAIDWVMRKTISDKKKRHHMVHVYNTRRP
jgi:hypothetical protein